MRVDLESRECEPIDMRCAVFAALLGPLLLSACSSDPSVPGGSSSGGAPSTGGTFSAGGQAAGGTASSSGGASNSSGGATSSDSGGSPTGGDANHAAGGHPASDGGTGGVTSSSGGQDGTGGQTSTRNDCPLPELTTALSAATSSLEIVDWAGKKAAISYTFDDGNTSQITNYDVLNDLDVPFTFYLITNWGNARNAIWKRAIEDGHEIGNHSHTHPETGTGADLDTATAFIETSIGITPLTMAAPYGSNTYPPLAQSRFLFNRGVGGGSVAPNSNVDRYNLPTFIPATNANKAALDNGVSQAVNQGRWQSVLVHGFTGGNDSAYQPVPLNDFLEHVRGQRDSGQVWIGTLLDVGAYFLAQRLVSGATPQVNGNRSTWSWTLPAHFPEGRCLRVRSTGTVLQNDAPLTRDPMGYTDISLDVGAVTVVTSN